MKTNMIERFKSVDYMSCTCDMWSHSDRCFIAMKSHYIDDKTGLLVSDMLALRRMYSKDHLTVTTAIVSILEEYGIREKTTSITTDNAGEFCCAFKKFSENFEQFKEPRDTIEFSLGNDDDDNFLLNTYLTEQSILAINDDGDDDDENDGSGDAIDGEVIRGTEIIKNGQNIMPMANDVGNRACNYSNSSQVADANKFVLYDLLLKVKLETKPQRNQEYIFLCQIDQFVTHIH